MRNESVLDTAQSQRVALQLHNATRHTAAYFGSDVRLAYRLAARLLQHESAQRGFRLAATQDVHFTEVRGGPRCAPGPGEVGWDGGGQDTQLGPLTREGCAVGPAGWQMHWDQLAAPGHLLLALLPRGQGAGLGPRGQGDGLPLERRVGGCRGRVCWGPALVLGARMVPQSQGGAELCAWCTWCPPGKTEVLG